MTEWLSQLESKYSLLNKNYKILAVVALFLVVFVFWYMIVSREFSTMNINRKSIRLITNENTLLKKQVQILTSKVVDNKTQEYQKEETQLQKKYLELTKQADVLQSHMILSTEVLAHLNNLLQAKNDVKLLSMHYLPEAGIKGVGGQPIFRLPIELVLQGNFFSIMDYLKNIEHQHTVIFWNEIDYKVIQYPDANVKLKINIMTSELRNKNAKID